LDRMSHYLHSHESFAVLSVFLILFFINTSKRDDVFIAFY